MEDKKRGKKSKSLKNRKMSHLSGRCPSCNAWMVAGACSKCGNNIKTVAPIVASARESSILGLLLFLFARSPTLNVYYCYCYYFIGEDLDDQNVITSVLKATSPTLKTSEETNVKKP
jgi:hypothetical protein